MSSYTHNSITPPNDLKLYCRGRHYILTT